ncbi:hypothetical protein EsH8_VII_000569 [Colletotrichum jinshuiense]
MEPPAKRPRTGPSPSGQKSKGNEDDELNYEPEEVSQMRDPGYQLEQSRAFAAFKLKSTFEHIFQKYERDFTGIGDEIDLRTGKIITNNGHLENMRNERDTGFPDEDEEDEGVLLEDAFASDDENDEDEESGEDGNPDQSDGEEDEDCNLHGKKSAGPPSTVLMPKGNGELQRRPSHSHSLPGIPKSGSEQRLPDLALPCRPGSGHSNPSANVWGFEPESVDPTWRVPEIPQPKLGDNLMSRLQGARYRFPVSQGSRSVWSSRPDSEEDKITPEPAQIDMAQLARARLEASRMARPTSTKLLQSFATGDDNGDDILGVSAAASFVKTKESANRKNAVSGRPDVSTAEKQHQELLHSVEDGPVETASTSSKSAVKDAKMQPNFPIPPELDQRPKKQGVPIKARKSKQTSGTSNIVDTPSQDQPVSTAAEVNASQNSAIFVTDREVQERPKQQLVIELFSRRPSPGEITDFVDPDDVEIYGFMGHEDALTSRTANLTVSETLSKVPVPQNISEEVMPDSNGRDSHNSPATTQARTKKVPEPPKAQKEMFTRHEIDASYAFSDDEDGIPTTRTRATRNGNPSVVAPDTIKSTEPTPQRTEPLEMGDLEDRREGETESSGFNTSANTGDAAAERLADMDVDAPAGEQAAEQAFNPRVQQTPEIFTGSDSNGRLQAAEERLPGNHQPTNEQITEEPDVASKEETKLSPQITPMKEPQPPGKHGQRQDQGFIIPLGLDEIEGTSATEPDRMGIELPILPAPAQEPPKTHTVLSPPRRAHPSTKKRSGHATSPMRRLNLQSSSPLKKYANPDSSAKARRSARFVDSANPKPRRPKPIGGCAASPGSVKAGHPRSTTIDISDSSTLAQPSPASRGPKRQQPSTPSTRLKKISKGSSSKKPIISLLSDDDDDELTLDLFKTWTAGSGGSSGGRTRTSYAPVLLAGPQTKITTPMKQRSPAGGGLAGSGTGTGAERGKKRKAAWAFATPTKTQLGSPSGSLVRTPGGNMRRCGEDGFRCDRDFCFTCL